MTLKGGSLMLKFAKLMGAKTPSRDVLTPTRRIRDQFDLNLHRDFVVVVVRLPFLTALTVFNVVDIRHGYRGIADTANRLPQFRLFKPSASSILECS
jgi:hypothetical protein